MSQAKRLSKRQLAVIEDLFTSEQDESGVLKKHKVNRILYAKWLADPAFAEQFDQRIAGAYRRSAFKIARSATEAVEELLKLAKSDKGETARKACLDIINMHHSPRDSAPVATSGKNESSSPESPNLSPETAGKLLAVLAEESSKKS
jgi:hypothetical protein